MAKMFGSRHQPSFYLNFAFVLFVFLTLLFTLNFKHTFCMRYNESKIIPARQPN